MNNLSFEELKALSVSVADSSLLDKISGGNKNACHDKIIPGPQMPRDNTNTGSGSDGSGG